MAMIVTIAVFGLKHVGGIAYAKAPKVMADDPLEKFQRSTAVWSKWYDWLQWYFPDEEAREYAEELTQVAEGRKRETERSPHEIRREMKSLANIEALIVAIRSLVTIAALTSPFYFLLFASVVPGFASRYRCDYMGSRRSGNPLRRLCGCCLEKAFLGQLSYCFTPNAGPVFLGVAFSHLTISG